LHVFATGRGEPFGQLMNVRVDVGHQIGLFSAHVAAHGLFPPQTIQRNLRELPANLPLLR
jgi:hypothetical protein